MKNLLLYILLSFLFFGCSEKKSENDIKNWDIEGIRIGDSLLNYMTKEEIIREIESSKNMYQNLTDEFGQVHLNRGFNKYDFLSFRVKIRDENYYIQSVSGNLSFDNKLNSCLEEQKKIEKKFSSKYPNLTKRKKTYTYPFDSTGESVSHNVMFDFESGGQFEVNCAVFKEGLKKKYKWKDGLITSIHTKEVVKWFDNVINEKTLD